MTAIDVNKFLISLADMVAQRSSLVFATAGPTAPRSLWLHEIVEGAGTADPASSLRLYGGPIPWGILPRPTASLQFMTMGSAAAAVMEQAWTIHAAMHDQGHPLARFAVPGKRLAAGVIEADTERDWEIVLASPLQRPGILGRDESGTRWMASGNWDIEFVEKVKS